MDDIEKEGRRCNCPHEGQDSGPMEPDAAVVEGELEDKFDSSEGDNVLPDGFSYIGSDGKRRIVVGARGNSIWFPPR